MGAETSILDNCHLSKAYSVSLPTYTVQPGETGDGQFINVFLQKRKKNVDSVKRFAKNLKLIRHPFVISYVATGVTAGVPFLATEQCIPLSIALESLCIEEIIAGINNIVQALIFLHEQIRSSHNNVSISAIYVDDNGSWKLSNFELMQKFTQMTTVSVETYHEHQDDVYIPPEEKKGVYAVAVNTAYSRDIYALGVVINQLLVNLPVDSDVSDLLHFARTTLQNSDPASRPTAVSLQQNPLFRNDYLNIVEHLRSLVTKSNEENKHFFCDLVPRIFILPEELVARRLTRPLLSRLVFHNETAASTIIPQMLTQKTGENHISSDSHGILSSQLFTEYVIPEILKIFTVRSLHIRLTLLKHFPKYMHSLTRDDILDCVFPQLLLGLRDTSDELVVASLQTLAYLVPLIGADTVIGGERYQFFERGQPKFQTNNHGSEDSSLKKHYHDNHEIKDDDNNIDESKEEHHKTSVTQRQEMLQRHAERRLRRESARSKASTSDSSEITGNDNVAYADSQRNSACYGTVEEITDNNELWDMVRNSQLQVNETEIDADSEFSSISANMEPRTIKVYDLDIIEDKLIETQENYEKRVNKNIPPLKLNFKNKIGNKHQKVGSLTSDGSLDSFVASNQSADVGQGFNDDWVVNQDWSPDKSDGTDSFQNSVNKEQSVNIKGSDFDLVDDSSFKEGFSNNVQKPQTRKSPSRLKNEKENFDNVNSRNFTASDLPNGIVTYSTNEKKKTKSKKSHGRLGEEYDFKTATHNTPKTDIDFFEDMLPPLPSPTVVNDKHKDLQNSNVSDVMSLQTAGKFDVQETTGGWGDNWDTDF